VAETKTMLKTHNYNQRKRFVMLWNNCSTPIYWALPVARFQKAWRPGTCCTEGCPLISW